MIGISVADAFKAIELLFKGLDFYVATDKRLFLDHVEPCYLRLEDINTDYLTKLQQAGELLRKPGNTVEAKVFVEQCQATRQTARDQIKALSTSWSNAKRTRRVPKEVSDFFESVLLYFAVSGGGNVGSAYTALSEILEEAMFDKDLMPDDVEPLYREVRAIMARVRDRWMAVSHAYAMARISMLR